MSIGIRANKVSLANRIFGGLKAGLSDTLSTLETSVAYWLINDYDEGTNSLVEQIGGGVGGAQLGSASSPNINSPTIGKWYDPAKVDITVDGVDYKYLSPELVVDGGFDDPDEWQFNRTDTVVAGRSTCWLRSPNQTSFYVRQPNRLEVGKQYLAQFYVTQVDVAGAGILFSDGVTTHSQGINTLGLHSVYFQATGTTVHFSTFQGPSDIYFDTVSVREVAVAAGDYVGLPGSTFNRLDGDQSYEWEEEAVIEFELVDAEFSNDNCLVAKDDSATDRLFYWFVKESRFLVRWVFDSGTVLNSFSHSLGSIFSGHVKIVARADNGSGNSEVEAFYDVGSGWTSLGTVTGTVGTGMASSILEKLRVGAFSSFSREWKGGIRSMLIRKRDNGPILAAHYASNASQAEIVDSSPVSYRFASPSPVVTMLAASGISGGMTIDKTDPLLTYTDGSPISGGSGAYYISGNNSGNSLSLLGLEFDYDGSEIEFWIDPYGTSFRLYVDGETIDKYRDDYALGGDNYLSYDFGSSATRRLRFEAENSRIKGVVIESGASVTKIPEKERTVLITDSFGNRGGVVGAMRAYPYWLRKLYPDWDVWNNTNDGCGYWAAGLENAPLVDRVQSDILDYSPDRIVIALGYNDKSDFAALSAASQSVWEEIAAADLNIPMYCVLPWVTTDALSVDSNSIAAAAEIRIHAEAAGAIVFDPRDWYVLGSERWTTVPGNFHPSEDGHEWIAQQIALEIGGYESAGHECTVSRSSSGYKTVVVSRPVVAGDGADDYLEVSATGLPTAGYLYSYERDHSTDSIAKITETFIPDTSGGLQFFTNDEEGFSWAFSETQLSASEQDTIKSEFDTKLGGRAGD